jgi:enamine deaminase RidA (YjgF/YER057c/UK114 family)
MQAVKGLGISRNSLVRQGRRVVAVSTDPGLVFVKDLDDFGRINTAFERLLPTPKPARSCFQVARNPGDARIEIEGIAYVPL